MIREYMTRTVRAAAGLRGAVECCLHSRSLNRVSHSSAERQYSQLLWYRCVSLTRWRLSSPRRNVVLHGHQHVRGKKTKSTVKLEQLPQGILPSLGPVPQIQDEMPAYPTVVLQARRNMQKFNNCVLLTRVGGFYELYFEHAEEFGPLLNLKVAQKKTNAGPVSMAGFPFFQLDRFLKTLVQDLNRYVAIAEEFANDASAKVKSGGLMHDRRVARIITPGTLIDENFMDPYVNNYIMAIHAPTDGAATNMARDAHSNMDAKNKTDVTSTEEPPSLGIAWLDLSTGYFFTQTAKLGSLSAVLSRVAPREIVLDKELESRQTDLLFSILAEDKHLITYAPPGEMQTLSDWAPMLESAIPAATARDLTTDEIQAGSLLLDYVKDRLQGLSMKLQPPLRHETMQVMGIDRNTMRSLEIKQTIRDGAFRGSLLHAVRRTVTKSGARLLNEWLSAPSTSVEVITFRQDLVSRFLADEQLRETITLLLRRTHDSQRLVQKFALNRGEPDDLLGLASTIKATEDIVGLLQQNAAGGTDYSRDCLSTMVSRISLEQPTELAARIRDAIDEEGLVQQHQQEDSEAGEMMALAQQVVNAEGSSDDAAATLPKGAVAKASKRKGAPTSIREHYGEDNEAWIMRPEASTTLARLHGKLSDLKEERIQLTEDLRTRFNAASLTLRWNPSLGHICHVKGKDAKLTASDNASDSSSLRTLSSSRSTRSFHLQEWTSLGERLDKQRLQIRAEEQRVFASLRAHVVRNLVKLRRNAAVLDELDITTSFARLAAEQGWTRPIITSSSPPTTNITTTILGGRHPTVELGLATTGRTFQHNDCFLGSANHGRVWLITGPNMAGKSTFLRQNALIAILAQIGCFVPADHAELAVVDALYTRVGSADNLFADQSTFMVEMLETAAILRGATERSFVVMDEIGRGTTPEDGTAVAFAALWHLVSVNRCRGLFATHFHGVADLLAERGMLLGGWDGKETVSTQNKKNDPSGDGKGAVEVYCTDVEEDGRGGFVYVHKLRKGVNRRSHALKVARLAGLPEDAVKVARDVLRSMGQDDSA